MKRGSSACGLPCPSKTAQRLCPEGIFVPPRFDAYKAVSRHIREIFSRYTDIIEPLSLDKPTSM